MSLHMLLWRCNLTWIFDHVFHPQHIKILQTKLDLRSLQWRDPEVHKTCLSPTEAPHMFCREQKLSFTELYVIRYCQGLRVMSGCVSQHSEQWLDREHRIPSARLFLYVFQCDIKRLLQRCHDDRDKLNLFKDWL